MQPTSVRLGTSQPTHDGAGDCPAASTIIAIIAGHRVDFEAPPASLAVDFEIPAGEGKLHVARTFTHARDETIGDADRLVHAVDVALAIVDPICPNTLAMCMPTNQMHAHVIACDPVLQMDRPLV